MYTISHDIETLTGEVSIDHVVTIICSAGNVWVLAFVRAPLWRVSSTQIWLQTKYPPLWQQHSLMAVPPCRTVHLQHCRNSSGMVRWTWTGLWIPQIPDQLSICGMCQSQLPSILGPHGSFLTHGTSNGCSVGLRSGEFRAQVDTLRSLSCSLGRSWAVFAVLQLRCPAGRPLPLSSVLAMSGPLGLQRCLGEWCFSKRPRECWDSRFPSRTWHFHKMIYVVIFICHWF